MYKHKCHKPHKTDDALKIRYCRACDENKSAKERREQFIDMMKVSLQWDIEDQGLIL